MQMNILLPPEIAAAFKAKCTNAGVSMRSEIIRLVSESAPVKPIPGPLTTRRDRRKTIKAMIPLLEAIVDAETRYAERIPENLRSGAAYEAAEETISALEDALESLDEAY
jgi:hypothetical protein